MQDVHIRIFHKPKLGKKNYTDIYMYINSFNMMLVVNMGFIGESQMVEEIKDVVRDTPSSELRVSMRC